MSAGFQIFWIAMEDDANSSKFFDRDQSIVNHVEVCQLVISSEGYFSM